MNNRNVLAIIGVIICLGVLIVMFTGALSSLIDRFGQSPSTMIFALVFCGGCYAILKALFPNHSSTWYFNRIKIVFCVIALAAILIALIARP